MPLNLVEAGKAVGLSKTTILKAIKQGRLSASQDEITKGWAIDPAELYRVYPPELNSVASNMGKPLLEALSNHRDGEMLELRARLNDAQDQIIYMRERFDRMREDLVTERGELAAERKELAAERAKITALLTDQRPRRKWWQWR